MRWINRLEFKLGRYAIPNLMHLIAVLTVIAFILYKLDPKYLEPLYFDRGLILRGQIWRLVTFVIIPPTGNFPFPDYLNNFMYFFYLRFIGNGLEQAWGTFKLNLFYFIGVLGAILAAFLFPGFPTGIYLNASLFFAFARFYPDLEIYFFFILPVKIKWLAWLSAAGILFSFVALGGQARAIILLSLANYLIFFGREIFMETRMRRDVSDRRSRFKQSAAQESEALHRCSVCAKTDLTHPELDFRVGKDGEDYCIEHLPK